MKPTFRNIGFLVLASCAALALAQDTWSLKRVAKVGDTASYKMTAEIDFAGAEAVLNAMMIDKVVAVEPSGEYVVESAMSGGTISINGSEMAIPEEKASKARFKASGEVLDIEHENEEMKSVAWRMARISSFVLGQTSVKIGDEWTFESPADEAKKLPAVKATYKVEGVEKVGEFDAVKIKSLVKEGGTDGGTVDGFTWIDPRDGSLVKSEVTWTNVAVPGAPMPLNAKVKMTREK